MKNIVCYTLIALLLVPFCTQGKGGGNAATTTAIIVASSHVHPFDMLKGKKYDGYIVYGEDTVRGLISFPWSSVKVENELFNKIASHDLDNKKLHAITLVDNQGNTLYITRLVGGRNKLCRVVYEDEKLKLYDRYFVFGNAMKSADLGSMYYQTEHDKKVQDLNNFPVLSPKRKLVQVVNEVYGTTLSPKDYTRKELLQYIGELQ